MKRLFVLLLCLSLATALSACRRGTVSPTSQPTQTPTPRSTSLPPVETPIPVGAEGNAIHMVFSIGSTVRSEQSIREAIDDLEAAILEETSLVVQVDRVDTDADAVAALCNSINGTVTLAWLNGIAYTAADAQSCGTAALQAERDGSTTERAVLIVNADSGISGVADLDNKNFCRVSATDFYTWLMPSIIMASNAFSPADLRSITEYEDVPALLTAVDEGDCDAAGVSERDFESAGGNVSALSGGIPVPISILTVPEVLPQAQAQALTAALIEIGNGIRATMLEPMLNQDAIVEVDSGDLSAIRSVITRAGVDLAAMGGH